MVAEDEDLGKGRKVVLLTREWHRLTASRQKAAVVSKTLLPDLPPADSHISS
jgi:hypothetical protein